MRPLQILSAWLLIATSCLGAIEINEQYEQGEPIVAHLTNAIPPGAEIMGGWAVSDGAKFESCGAADHLHIWARDGQHTVTFAGVWLLTKEVTLPDGQKFKALEGFGSINESAAFKVGAAVPPPLPAARAIILEESEQRTTSQASLWGQVRNHYGQSKLPILDVSSPGSYTAIVQAALAKSGNNPPLPALVTIDTAGGVIGVEPCPATLAAIQARLGE